ncbi:MAG: hypothetical protein ACLFSC_03230 [Wenzhouxiangella sp.]
MVLQPARSMAGAVVFLTLLAACAVLQSGSGGLASLVIALLTLVTGARATYRLLSPNLVLRLDDGRLLWRRGRTWASEVRSPFVSPWFIGWRGRGLSGCGVFAGQLPKDRFRRLARTLRQQGSNPME